MANLAPSIKEAFNESGVSNHGMRGRAEGRGMASGERGKVDWYVGEAASGERSVASYCFRALTGVWQSGKKESKERDGGGEKNG